VKKMDLPRLRKKILKNMQKCEKLGNYDKLKLNVILKIRWFLKIRCDFEFLKIEGKL
jgi:hypothetical protein